MPQLENLLRLLVMLYGEDARFMARARSAARSRPGDPADRWLWAELLRELEGEGPPRLMH